MPDFNQLLTHPQLGPALSATTWVALPVVGATHTFALKVSRLGSPVSNASVTVKVQDANGIQVYPATGLASLAIDPRIPGTYTLTPATTNIFTQAGGLYKAIWSVTVPAVTSSVTGSITGTTMTVTNSLNGKIAIGQVVSGSTVVIGTVVTGFGPGTTGGVGTYTVTPSQQVNSTTLTCTGDPQMVLPIVQELIAQAA